MGFKIVSYGTPTVFPPPPGTPRILYTDAETGPLTGGENGHGCFLSIYGVNFGNSFGLGSTVKVYVGDVEVYAYKVHAAAVTNFKFNVTKITVQLGSLGGAVNGVPLAVKVTLNSVPSNTDVTFTPCAGSIRFVSLSGDDVTARAAQGTDINLPFRHLQLGPNLERHDDGCYKYLVAGDHVVIRGGTWTDTGFEEGWLRFRDPWAQGTPTKWIHFTSYPGETVTYNTPANKRGGFVGPGSSYAGTCGEYCSFSNLYMTDVNALAFNDAAPFNEQSGEGPWKVVNCEIGPWPALGDARAGGYSGGGGASKILGNYIHDINRICDSQRVGDPTFTASCGVTPVGGGESLLNHGIYIDSGSNGMEIAYNVVMNITDGSMLQTFDSSGGGILDPLIHNNWFENEEGLIHYGKFGINLADGTNGAINVYNNVVINVAQAGLRLNVAYQPIAGFITYNTFINSNKTNTNPDRGVFATNNDSGTTGYLRIGNNIFYNDHSLVDKFFDNSGAGGGYIAFFTNLCYLNGQTVIYPQGTMITSNPNFVNVATRDLSLQPGSPAIDTATAVTGFTAPTYDVFLMDRPGVPSNDLGAIETT